MADADLTAEIYAEAAAVPRPERRLTAETETLEACASCRGEGEIANDERMSMDVCDECVGTGKTWHVTARTYQIGVPFEEASAHAYIRNLHAHIRKAAATVDQAAQMLRQAGKQAEAKGMEAAAKAILEPVEGQD